MATIPNFGDLVQQQYGEDRNATNLTNMANRPNQYNPLGNTTWGLNPDGSWGQSTTLSGGAQGLWDASMQGQQNLAGIAGKGIDQSNMMGWGNADLQSGLMGFGNTDITRGAVAMPDSGFGASQQVIDAWNALQQPGLNKDAEAQRARAAAMGMTLGSQGWGDVENTIGTNNRNAANEGILRGTQEYQNVFNRGLASRQQTVKENLSQAELMNSERTQQYGERKGEADLRNQMRQQQENERKDAMTGATQGIQALTGMRDSLNPNKWNAQVSTSAGYKPLNILGAAQEQFNAETSNENQATANRNANINSGINAFNAAGGINGIGSLLSGAGSFAKDVWSGWGGTSSQPYNVGGSAWNDYAAKEAAAAGNYNTFAADPNYSMDQYWN